MNEGLERFKKYMLEEEKSDSTIAKYIHDVSNFINFTGTREITKEIAVNYKRLLMQKGYSPISINTMMAGINKYLEFLGLGGCKTRYLRIQRYSYTHEEEILNGKDYMKMCKAVSTNERNHLILNTLCSTGIRVSELKYFKVEALNRGEIEIDNKGKHRTILIPTILRKELIDYAKEKGITSGSVFLSKSGKPLDRTNIWRLIKVAASSANVDKRKAYPHNLRKLFARQFYDSQRDLSKLADVLGHSSVDTTRIYIKTEGESHQNIIDSLNLIC